MQPIRIAILAAAAGMIPGAAVQAVTLSNPVADGAIVLDDSRDDWNGLERYPDDGNESYPIDIGFITIAHDSSMLYIRYQMYHPSPTFSGNWKLLIDTDQDTSTGYHGQNSVYQDALGAEVMIEGASAFQFTGATQDAFSWNWMGFHGFSETGEGPNDIELAVPLSWIGNPQTFNFILWVDSNSDGGISDETLDDHLPNGAYGGSTATVHTYTLVPEPASLSVLSLGAMGLLRRRSA